MIRTRPMALFFCAAFLALAAGAVFPVPAKALCGDLSGDGYVRASDALAVLSEAVRGRYDSRADLAPPGSGDGRVTATDALVALRAAVAGTTPWCPLAPARVVVSLAACDFVTGGLAAIDAAELGLAGQRPGAVAADTVLRWSGGRLFAIGRFGADAIAELDPDTLDVLWQCSVGAGSNPHDLVLVSPTLGYVSRFDSASLAIIDPSAGPSCQGFLRGEIDLGALADADGFPEMDQMALVGDRLFVALERLDRNDFFRPATNAALAVVDTSRNTLEGAVELTIENPFAETKGLIYDPDAGLLYAGGPGRLFTDLEDGGIEVVDPVSSTSLGLVASGKELGGDLTDFALAGSGRVFAIVADASFVASVIDFDVATGTRRLLFRSPFLVSDIELSADGRLWVADRNCSQPGVRVFDVDDGHELTPDPIYPGLTPFNLLPWRK
ncbi:MAG: hypothetical protein D6815_11705 [Candidatus Dadabacteria bacterium]|nr:MAG: hypothetical protein D6815_11705 [Candidatus Dadabacteria bacterium]